MAATPPAINIVHNLLRAHDWQVRPEYGEVCDWWRHGGRGVLALVGIGGAGKTAITERFLRELPDVYAEHEELPHDKSLKPGGSVMVYSFYQERNAEVFMAQLTAWVRGQVYDESAPRPKYATMLDSVRMCGHRLLLVLDGLEVVQDDGSRGGRYGQILDPSLRNFVCSIAEGSIRFVSVITTTRFRLYDVELRKCPFYRPIRVEELSPDAAVKLLRVRGVRRGTLAALKALAGSLGHHALTVDLMGGFIGRYCGGDPARLPPDPMDEIADATALEATVDIDAARILEQQRRFARVAARYREAFIEHDPASLALLERVCLFRLGVDAGSLVNLFTGPDKAAIAGEPLAGLGTAEVNARLTLLAEMRLLERTQSGQYTAHPAVRDGFASGFDAAASQASHKAARQGLEAMLGERPSEGLPADAGRLDLLEEIIHHAVAVGQHDDAWAIYVDRLGAYSNLGWRLGQFERGDRICQRFVDGRPSREAPLPDGMSEALRPAFLNEWGLYLADLSRLDDSAACLKRASELIRRPGDVARCLLNLAEVHLLTGRLRDACRAAERAARLSTGTSLLPVCLAAHKHVRSLLGEVPPSVHAIRSAMYWQFIEAEARAQYKLRGILSVPAPSHATFALRPNRLWARAFARSSERLHDQGVASLLQAEAALVQGDYDAVGPHLYQAREMTLNFGFKEIRCWLALLQGRLALARLRQPRAGTGAYTGDKSFQEGLSAVEEGLATARECGYSVFHVDLLVLRARYRLLAGELVNAERDLRAALYGRRRADTADGIDDAEPLDESALAEQRGTFPPTDAARPALLAATHPDSEYSSGEADARQLTADVLQARGVRPKGDSAGSIPYPVVTDSPTLLESQVPTWDVADAETRRPPPSADGSVAIPSNESAMELDVADGSEIQRRGMIMTPDDEAKIYQRLSKLLAQPGKLDQLIMELGLDAGLLPGASSPPATHARAVFEQLKLRVPPELERLATAIGFTPTLPNLEPARSDSARLTPKPCVLVLAANALASSPLKLDDEADVIRQNLRRGDYGRRYLVEVVRATTAADLSDHLLRFQPEVAHFSGHGLPGGDLVLAETGPSRHVKPAGPGAEADTTRRATLVDAVARLFAVLPTKPRCVVLNACYSDDLAAKLVDHVECVVGMTRAIGDTAALRFSEGFYRALSYGHDFKAAFDLGCVQVDLAALPEAAVPRFRTLHREERPR